MLDSGRVIEDHGDQIEADCGGLDSGPAGPGPRGTTLRDDFHVIQRPLGRSVLVARPRFHLDENRLAILFGNDIDLGKMRSHPVARQDAEAFPLEIAMGKVLTAAPERTIAARAAAQGGVA